LLAALWPGGWVARRQGSKGAGPEFLFRRLFIAVPPLLWLEGLVFIGIVAIGFLLKRLGQPKGIAALEAQTSLSGMAQVFAIYSDFSFDLGQGWAAIHPFFGTMPALIFGPLAGIAVLVAGWPAGRGAAWLKKQSAVGPVLFLAFVLILTTLEMILFVSPDRRDDKYLFMLLPLLFLLGGQGMAVTGSWLWSLLARGRPAPILATVGAGLVALLVLLLGKPQSEALLANTGDDYETAFAYVRDHWQAGDKVLTGTPTAATLYLGRNDFYGVQRSGGYDYRLLTVNDQAVDRWLGSPAIRTEAALHQTLAGSRVWLVLERWGLQREYYDPPFQQQLLAQTEPVGAVEAQGIFVLRAKPNPQPLALTPAQPLAVVLGEQVQLSGYTVEPDQARPGQALRLTLYWQALTPLPYDYTVLVHLRRPGGEIVAQADHRPLGPLYPTTLWPVAEIIRESSDLYLPADSQPGLYELWSGMYRLETGQRLPVRDDTSGENAIRLGTVRVN
jgi:hypothetical protein